VAVPLGAWQHLHDGPPHGSTSRFARSLASRCYLDERSGTCPPPCVHNHQPNHPLELQNRARIYGRWPGGRSPDKPHERMLHRMPCQHGPGLPGDGSEKGKLVWATRSMGAGDVIVESERPELGRGLAFMQKILNSSVLKRGGSTSLSLACANRAKSLLGRPWYLWPTTRTFVHKRPVGSKSLRGRVRNALGQGPWWEVAGRVQTLCSCLAPPVRKGLQLSRSDNPLMCFRWCSPISMLHCITRICTAISLSPAESTCSHILTMSFLSASRRDPPTCKLYASN